MASELVLVSIGQYDVRIRDGQPLRRADGPGVVVPRRGPFSRCQATFDSQRAQLSAVLTGLEAFLGPYPGNSTGIVVDFNESGYALETQDRPTRRTSVSEHVRARAHPPVVRRRGRSGRLERPLGQRGHGHLGPDEHAEDNNENGSSGSGTPPARQACGTPAVGDHRALTDVRLAVLRRGAMTYEALRAAIGDPAFFQLIKQWQTDFGGQTKRGTDLIALAEQISGRNLTRSSWTGSRSNKPVWPPAPPTPSGTTCEPPSSGPPPTTPTPTRTLQRRPVQSAPPARWTSRVGRRWAGSCRRGWRAARAEPRSQLSVVRGRQADQGRRRGDVQAQAVEARQADQRAGDGERTRVRRRAAGQPADQEKVR